MNDYSIGWAGRVMQWLQFAVRLVLINVLFIGGLCAGLVLFGLFPSAVAATTLLARLRAGAAGDHLVRDFITVYRAQFLHANRVGSVFWLAAVVLFLNVLTALSGAAAPGTASPVQAVLLVLAAAAGVGTVTAAATAVVICSRYRDTVYRTWRLAFVLPLVSPVMSISLLVTLVLAAVVFSGLNVLIPLIGASIPLLLSGWLVGSRLGALETAV
jgi:uncharacterized membrane protein YesL